MESLSWTLSLDCESVSIDVLVKELVSLCGKDWENLRGRKVEAS